MRACQAINAVARDLNLIAVDPSVLDGLDSIAPSDAYAATFRTRLIEFFDGFARSLNVEVASDALSVYGEALVYWLLHDRVKIEPIQAGSISMPDFRVEMQDGTTFFLEVKTLEYAGGVHTHRKLQTQALGDRIELDERLKKSLLGPSGNKVASVSRQISPLGPRERDVSGSCDEIKKLIHRLHGRFKSSQLNAGPTFVVAPLMRLAPATMVSFDALDLLAFYPYFRSPLNLGNGAIDSVLSVRAPVIPGRLWHVAFGTPGQPLPDVPEFVGAPRLSTLSTLDDFGLLVPGGTRFISAAGMLFIESYSNDVQFGQNNKGYVLLGLFDPMFTVNGWDDLATMAAMNAMGALWNDSHDSRLSFC